MKKIYDLQKQKKNEKNLFPKKSVQVRHIKTKRMLSVVEQHETTAQVLVKLESQTEALVGPNRKREKSFPEGKTGKKYGNK